MQFERTVFFTLVVLALVFSQGEGAHHHKSKSCGYTMFKRVQNLCNGPCIDESGDIATKYCSSGINDEELIQVCCPNLAQSVSTGFSNK